MNTPVKLHLRIVEPRHSDSARVGSGGCIVLGMLPSSSLFLSFMLKRQITKALEVVDCSLDPHLADTWLVSEETPAGLTVEAHPKRIEST